MKETSNFNFSIAELCQRGDKLVLLYTRDEADFKLYGYNTKTIEEIKTMVATLKEFLSDDYYEGKQKVATDTKNTIRLNLETNIVNLRNRAKLVFGAKSIDYSLFRFEKLNKHTDNELVQFALHVYNIAEPRLNKLEKRLVTPQDMEEILTNRTLLDDAIDKQAEAVSERREKKIGRNALANKLYAYFVELSEVGKLIWKTTNEAFYTDYVIYGSSKSIHSQETEEGLGETTEE